MKKCPFCAEEIQEEAIKCRYCHEFLDGRPSPAVVVQGESLPWYFKGSFLFLTFVTLPPVVLPLVWLHPKMHWAMKVAISVAVIVVTWVMVDAMIRFVNQMDEALKMWDESPF